MTASNLKEVRELSESGCYPKTARVLRPYHLIAHGTVRLRWLPSDDHARKLWRRWRSIFGPRLLETSSDPKFTMVVRLLETKSGSRELSGSMIRIA